MAATLPLPAIDEKLIWSFRVPDRDCSGLSALDSNFTGWAPPCGRDFKIPRFTIEPTAPNVQESIATLPPMFAVRAPYPVSRFCLEIERIIGTADAMQQVPTPVEFIISGGMGCIQDAWTPLRTFTAVGHEGQFLIQVEGRLANQFELRARAKTLVPPDVARKSTWQVRVMLDRADTSASAIIEQLGGNVT